MSKFDREWSEYKTGITAALKPGPPLKHKIELATKRIEAQIQYLNGAISLLTQRDKSLFQKVVDAYSKHDLRRANVYANELAEIRKMANFMMNAELALERVALRLKTVTEIGNVAAVLAPVGRILQSVRTSIAGVFPSAERELSEITTLLDEIMIEASQVTGMTPDFEAASEEAQKILSEAAIVAEARMKEKFPELPALKAPAEEAAQPK
ncbi:MAG: Snf7 family protein [Candidatus Bathyarchaeota archaeon]|nr:Snf7 family protein [Candidatus Bathyarchaeota archaeon]